MTTPDTKSSVIADTARVTTRSVTAVDRLAVTVTLNMAHVISLTELPTWNSVPSKVVSANTLNCFKSRLNK